MIGYIYLTVNDIDGTVYVGKRQKSKIEKSYKGSGTHLKLALSKYGKHNFYTYTLESCDSVYQLNQAEKKWISIFRNCGVPMYNIAPGGDGGNMINWGELPKEKRDAINRKNSISHMGQKNGFFGRHHSDETKRIIREKNLNKTAPKELLDYKKAQRDRLPKVAQIDRKTGEIIRVWENWCEAGKHINPNVRCAYSHISECCNGTRKSAYGFAWKREGGCG